MLRTNQKNYDVYENGSALDSYGQKIPTNIKSRSIEANIVFKDKIVVENNVKFIISTHFAITSDRLLVEGMRLKNSTEEYTIIKVNNSGRMTQLDLLKV